MYTNESAKNRFSFKLRVNQIEFTFHFESNHVTIIRSFSFEML